MLSILGLCTCFPRRTLLLFCSFKSQVTLKVPPGHLYIAFPALSALSCLFFLCCTAFIGLLGIFLSHFAIWPPGFFKTCRLFFWPLFFWWVCFLHFMGISSFWRSWWSLNLYGFWLRWSTRWSIDRIHRVVHGPWSMFCMRHMLLLPPLDEESLLPC